MFAIVNGNTASELQTLSVGSNPKRHKSKLCSKKIAITRQVLDQLQQALFTLPRGEAGNPVIEAEIEEAIVLAKEIERIGDLTTELTLGPVRSS